jgi:dihydropyrimidinase
MLAGGTTMHVDFALPVHHDLRAGHAAWQAKAAAGCADYGLHMAVTAWNDKARARACCFGACVCVLLFFVV